MIKIINSRDLREGEALGLTVNRQALIAARIDKRAHIYVNNCPHLGLTLNQGRQQFLARDSRHLQCANHGALFEIHTGTCVAGPCRGSCLQKITIQEFDGSIWLNN